MNLISTLAPSENINFFFAFKEDISISKLLKILVISKNITTDSESILQGSAVKIVRVGYQFRFWSS